MSPRGFPSWAGASANRHLPSVPDQWLDYLPDLERAPQLAILAALDITLHLAVETLLAVHPETEDRFPGGGHPPQIHLACSIMLLAEATAEAIESYRLALAADNAGSRTETAS